MTTTLPTEQNGYTTYACGHVAPENRRALVLRTAGLPADEMCVDCVRAHSEMLRQEREARIHRWTGSKYDRNLSIQDIAKHVRKDIKEAVAAGVLPQGKYSVRSDHYSMGQSLDVKTALRLSPKQREALVAIPRAYQWESHDPIGDHFSSFYLSVYVPGTPLENENLGTKFPNEPDRVP